MTFLDQYDRLLDQIRRYVMERGMSLRALSVLADVAPSAVNDLHREDWSPSATTLRRVLSAIDANGDVPRPAIDVDAFTLGLHPRFERPAACCVEREFKRPALGRIGPPSMKAVHKMIRQHPAMSTALLGEIRALVPGAAVHVVDAIGDDAAEFVVSYWDASTGFNQGRDYTGHPLSSAPDSAYVAQLRLSYMATRESGNVRFSFVARRGPDGFRPFYRLLEPLVGGDGRPQILAVTLPEKPDAVRHFIPDRFRI